MAHAAPKPLLVITTMLEPTLSRVRLLGLICPTPPPPKPLRPDKTFPQALPCTQRISRYFFAQRLTDLSSQAPFRNLPFTLFFSISSAFLLFCRKRFSYAFVLTMRKASICPALIVFAAGLCGSLLPLQEVSAAPPTDRPAGATASAESRGHYLDSDGRWRWARYRAKVAAQLPELNAAERAVHASIADLERALSEGEGLQYQQAYLRCLYGEVSISLPTPRRPFLLPLLSPPAAPNIDFCRFRWGYNQADTDRTE